MGWVADRVEDTVDAVVDVVDWVADEVIEPVADAVSDVVQAAIDNPVKTIAQIYATVTPGMQWMLPVIEGIDVAAKGGDIEDVAKAVAISIIAQEAGARVGQAVSANTTNAATAANYGTTYGSQQTTQLALQEAGSLTASQIAGNIAGSAAASATVAVVTGQDPVKAMITGGVNAAVPAVLGQVEGFQNLTPTTQKIIETAVKTQLAGGNVTDAVIRAAIVSSQLATDTVKALDSENKLTAGQQSMLADVVTAAAVTALAKGNVNAAIQKELFNAGSKALGDMAKGKFNELSQQTQQKAEQIKLTGIRINSNEIEQSFAITNFNTIKDLLSARINEQQHLQEEMDKQVAYANDLVKKYNADNSSVSRSTVDAEIAKANSSVTTYNDYVKKLNSDYEINFKPAFDKWETRAADLANSHNQYVNNFVKETEDLKNLSEQLGVEVKSLQNGLEKSYVSVLDPNFNPSEYSQINKLDPSIDPYKHWLSTGQYERLPTSFKSAESAVLDQQARLLTEALEARNLKLTNLTEDDRKRFYDTIEKQFGGDYNALKNSSIADFDIDDILRTSSSLTTNENIVKDTYNADNRPSVSTYTPPEGYQLATKDEIFGNKAILMPTSNGSFAWLSQASGNEVKNGYVWDPDTGNQMLRIEIIGVGDPLKIETHGVGNTIEELRDEDPLGWFEMYKDLAPDDRMKTDLGDTIYNYIKSTYDSFVGKIDPSTKEAIAKFAAAAKPESTTLALMSGMLNGIKSISDAFGADNRVSKALGDARGYIQSLYSAEAMGDKAAQARILDEAKNKGVLDQVIAAAEALAVYPNVIVEAAGTAVTGLATTMAASVLGAPAVVARMALYGTGAISGAGIIKGTIYEETKKALIDAGVDPATAEIKAQQAQAYNGKNLDSIIAGAGLGLIAGGTGFEKNFVKEVASNIAERVSAKQAAGQFVMGGLKEGIPEAAQGGQEKLAENIALQRLGFNVPTWQGVAAAGALEGLAGAPIGGASDVASKLKTYDLAFTTRQELEESAAKEGYILKPEDYARFSGPIDEQTALKQFYAYADPIATTEAEAREFLAAQGYVNPTAEDVQKITGQLLESKAQAEAIGIADPNVFDLQEIKHEAKAQGYTISDEEAQKLVRQVNESEALKQFRAQIDPLAVTYEEAREMLVGPGGFNYIPAGYDTSIARQFVQSRPEEEVRKLIGEYVDPRQITKQELEEWAKSQGLDPSIVGQGLTEQEIREYTDPYKDLSLGAERQKVFKERFDKYIDPIVTAEEEARAFLAAQGYVNPTTADVKLITGRILESKAQEQAVGIADPNVFDINEAKAIAAEEGYTLSDEQAKALARQVNEQEASQLFRTEIDPLAVTQAEAQEFFNLYGYRPSSDELIQFAISKPEAEVKSAISQYVEPRQLTLAELQELANLEGYKLSEEDIKNFVTQGIEPNFQVQKSIEFRKYADPLATLEVEARQFLADQGYTNPTQDDVNKIVGQILESEAQKQSIGIADPNVFDIDEVKTIAAEEGYSLTDEQAKALARQVNEQEASQLFRTEIDPLAVTQAEAKEFFDIYGYSPSAEELTLFTMSKPEAEVRPTIEPYVEPRQVTQEEAQAFFDIYGYKPTAEELVQFTKQGKDINQELVGKEIESYVDPRMVTSAEVLSKYRSLGLLDPTQEDVIRYVGQKPQEATLLDLEANIDRARYNQLKQSIAQQGLQAQQKGAQEAAMAALIGQAATPTVAADDAAKFKKPFITSATKQEEFKGPLQEFMEEVKTADYTAKPFGETQSQTTPKMQENTQQGESMPNYFTYGQPADIDQLFSPFGTAGTSFFGLEPLIAKRGGLVPPLMAGGGMTRYGRYAGGGLPMVAHSGKARVDFRQGDAVTGPGDGQSDDIPAMLADGEFVIPADVVAALGNGSTKAGSDKLYDMMHSIRSYHRSAKPKDLPPPAKKNPLDYLKKSKKK